MVRRVVIDIFFTAADGWFAEIGDPHGCQRSIVRNHYLREYPVLISGILSKEKVCIERYFSSGFFNFNRNAKGLRKLYPRQVFSIDKNGPGSFTCFAGLRSRWYPDLCSQPGFSHSHCLLHFKTTDRGDPFAKKPGRT